MKRLVPSDTLLAGLAVVAATLALLVLEWWAGLVLLAAGLVALLLVATLPVGRR